MVTIIELIWLASTIYCFIKTYRGHDKRSLDGVVGVQPGFDIFVILLFAPIFAPVDIGINLYKKYFN